MESDRLDSEPDGDAVDDPATRAAWTWAGLTPLGLAPLAALRLLRRGGLSALRETHHEIRAAQSNVNDEMRDARSKRRSSDDEH